jgi:hypothetical protein
MGANPAEGVRARLERVLSAEGLPAAARAYGENLLRRFGTPVRVVILGLPGSGKTQLLNMLVGRNLIANGSSLPSTEITAGASWRTRITRAEGATHGSDGIVLEGTELAGAKMLTLEAPLDILERISLLEASADASVESQRRAIEFAAKRAEILIWCTQEFSEVERLLWKLVPGGLKDHAFLALTKADELQRAGVLAQRLAFMNTALAEEFCAILPVATLRALAALAKGAGDQAAFAASGGRGLRAAVLKHVEQGRRADFDSALLFLRRHETAGSGGTPVGEPAIEAADASTGSAGGDAFLEQALDHLRKQSDLLAKLVPDADKDKYAKFLSACADAADGLGEMLSSLEHTAASSPLHDLVAEASEMLLLLQLEKGVGPAADAATLLLQVRREFEQELAG